VWQTGKNFKKFGFSTYTKKKGDRSSKKRWVDHGGKGQSAHEEGVRIGPGGGTKVDKKKGGGKGRKKKRKPGQ